MDKCFWSVSAKVRTESRDEAFGESSTPAVSKMGVFKSGGSSKRTRLFVGFITSDAGKVVIIFLSRTI